jgi:polyphosphate kinase
MVRRRKKAASIRSQETILRYLESGKLPRYPRSNMKKAIKRHSSKSKG